MSICSLAINPVSGFLQLLPTLKSKSNVTYKDGICKLNHIHISSSNYKSEYILPENAKSGDWIKIFGDSEFGWKLYIAYSKKIRMQNGNRILDHTHCIYSNMHKFDFIHLVYICESWHIENKSSTVGIS